MKGKVVEYRKDDIIMFLEHSSVVPDTWGEKIPVPSSTEAKVESDLGDYVDVRLSSSTWVPNYITDRTMRFAKGNHICLSAATMALNERQKYVQAEKRPPTLLVFDRWMYEALHLVSREHGGFGEKLFGCYWAAVDNPEFPWRVHASDPSQNYGPIYTSPPFLSQSPGTY